MTRPTFSASMSRAIARAFAPWRPGARRGGASAPHRGSTHHGPPLRGGRGRAEGDLPSGARREPPSAFAHYLDAGPARGVAIEAAAAADRPAIIALISALQAHERRLERGDAGADQTPEAHFEALARWVRREGGGALVARDAAGGRDGAREAPLAARSVIGVVIYGLEPSAPAAAGRSLSSFSAIESGGPARVGVISDLFICAEHRGRGLGRALVAAAEEALRDLGAQRVEITALASNEAAQETYEALGYAAFTITYSRPLR
ncbi:MAG: GNAT family N-acetyltransferase [Pseudomonadota bacterium]